MILFIFNVYVYCLFPSQGILLIISRDKLDTPAAKYNTSRKLICHQNGFQVKLFQMWCRVVYSTLKLELELEPELEPDLVHVLVLQAQCSR